MLIMVLVVGYSVLAIVMALIGYYIYYFALISMTYMHELRHARTCMEFAKAFEEKVFIKIFWPLHISIKARHKDIDILFTPLKKGRINAGQTYAKTGYLKYSNEEVAQIAKAGNRNYKKYHGVVIILVYFVLVGIALGFILNIMIGRQDAPLYLIVYIIGFQICNMQYTKKVKELKQENQDVYDSIWDDQKIQDDPAGFKEYVINLPANSMERYENQMAYYYQK